MIFRVKLILIGILSIGFTSSYVMGQTCSCAGAPLVNSQSLGAVEKGNFVFGLTADFNKIDQLYSGSKELNNRSSERETFTTLVEANYGLSSRITLSGTFSYVQKARKTGLQTSNNVQQLETAGIGDALVMLKYSLVKPSLWNPYQLMAGGGMKIPFATNSLKADGLALNADMQPGTGSWDGVGWMLFSYTVRSLDLNLYTMNSYKRTTSASRFSQDDEYKFGNEYNSLLGLSSSAFDLFSYSLQLKFRVAEADQRNDFEMPNTGGRWLNVVPGLGYSFNERFSMQVSGEVPLYQNVNGTQPTTTYILRASLFFSLNKANTGFNFGLPDNN